ncbi:MAG: GNAT family N-acetyltransferase [Solirubrobacteraceae bacterium]
MPALTQMLVRAFMDDPVAVWACRWEGLRPQMLEGMYRARLRQMLVHKEVWTNPGLTSAALWMPPGRWKTTLRQDAALVSSFLNPRLLVRLPFLAIGLSGVQRQHPRTPPHWYLSLLGTDPDAQGSGFGSAVLQPALRRCDSEGVGAYLESSKPRNLDFYARYGFRITGELQLPRGPKMWPMWRDAGGRHA